VLQPRNIDKVFLVYGVAPPRATQQHTLGLGKATPDALLLTDGQSVRGALRTDRAGLADPFRGRFPQPAADSPQVVVGMEELGSGTVTAIADHLPFPDLADRS